MLSLTDFIKELLDEDEYDNLIEVEPAFQFSLEKE